MLNAWHLPVAPFVKQNKDNLVITLWLAGENQPERVTLRAEIDNEETGLKMHITCDLLVHAVRRNRTAEH